MSVAGQALLAREMAGQDPVRRRAAGRHLVQRSIAGGAALAGALSAATLLLQRPLLDALSRDPAVRAAAAAIMPLVLLAQVT